MKTKPKSTKITFTPEAKQFLKTIVFPIGTEEFARRAREFRWVKHKRCR